MHTLAKQIKGLREANGLSLSKLAEKASVNRITLHRIEKGGDVRLQTLQDVLKVLGAEVMIVPSALREELTQFIQSGGKMLGRQPGMEAPPSVIAALGSVYAFLPPQAALMQTSSGVIAERAKSSLIKSAATGPGSGLYEYVQPLTIGTGSKAPKPSPTTPSAGKKSR